MEQFQELAPNGVRARYLIAVNLRTVRAAKLLKLGVERLPVGAVSGLQFTVIVSYPASVSA